MIKKLIRRLQARAQAKRMQREHDARVMDKFLRIMCMPDSARGMDRETLRDILLLCRPRVHPMGMACSIWPGSMKVEYHILVELERREESLRAAMFIYSMQMAAALSFAGAELSRQVRDYQERQRAKAGLA